VFHGCTILSLLTYARKSVKFSNTPFSGFTAVRYLGEFTFASVAESFGDEQQAGKTAWLKNLSRFGLWISRPVYLAGAGRFSRGSPNSPGLLIRLNRHQQVFLFMSSLPLHII
jgi:hypothetical protein